MKLFETLFILYKCNKAIATAYEVYHESDSFFTRLPAWQTSMGDYIFLECNNFLDEYNAMGSNVEAEFFDRVKIVKEIAKPIKKQINRWQDLEKFRNNFIGHTYRDRGKFVIPDLAIYNVPRNQFEIIQLSELIKYIWDVVKSEFAEEVPLMLKYMANLVPPSYPRKSYSGINADLEQMGLAVQAACDKHGRPYPLKIIGYQGPDGKPL